jgi:predicted O-methyltransferase YrrM
MPKYRADTLIPPLVLQAVELARQHGFERSCIPEVGRLLGVLAGHVTHGVVGEIGTGTGIGAAWMVANMATTAHFVTVESDAERAAISRKLLRNQPNARVIHGDWRAILAYGPFDLLFVDAEPAKTPIKHSAADAEAATELILHALSPRGIVVLDDLSPEEHRPEEWRGRPDPVREFWLNDPRLNATEVLTTPMTVAILATLIR